jgi:hypothetical protein
MFLPNIADRHLSLAPHCLPRRTQDPAAVSPRIPTASLDTPQDPAAVSPLLLADYGDTTDSRNK